MKTWQKVKKKNLLRWRDKKKIEHFSLLFKVRQHVFEPNFTFSFPHRKTMNWLQWLQTVTVVRLCYINIKSMTGEGRTKWDVSLLIEYLQPSGLHQWKQSKARQFVSLWIRRRGLHHLISKRKVAKTCNTFAKLQNPGGKQKSPPWWLCTQWETSSLFLTRLTEAWGLLAAAQ